MYCQQTLEASCPLLSECSSRRQTQHGKAKAKYE
jgi:hypothetical protein